MQVGNRRWNYYSLKEISVVQKPTSVESSNVGGCEKFRWQSFLRRNVARQSTEVPFWVSRLCSKCMLETFNVWIHSVDSTVRTKEHQG